MTYSSAQIAEFLAQYNESNTSLNEFCRQKQISVGTMSNWLNGALPKRRRSHGFHKTWYPEIEEELLRWVLERRDQGYAVYRKDMKEYQKKFSKTRKFGPFRTRAKFTGPMLTVHFTHGRYSKVSRNLPLDVVLASVNRSRSARSLTTELPDFSDLKRLFSSSLGLYCLKEAASASPSSE